MRFRWLAAVPLVLVLLLPSVVQAKTVTDADDLSYNIDFKKVSLTKPSSSKLSWTFSSWSSFTGTDMLGGANPTLNLDSRGGKAVDYKILVGWDPINHYYCQLRKAGGGTLATGVASRPDGKTARCIVASTKIKKSKPIHWRALVVATGVGRDVAPNSGWAVGT